MFGSWMAMRHVITMEEGFQILQKGITKLFNIVEGLEPNFTAEERLTLYTTVLHLCWPYAKPSYEQELYNLYKETCEDYIKSKVLPSLQEKQDQPLLRELLKGWSNYKLMTKRLSRIFNYLGRSIYRNELHSLEEISCLSFYNLVYEDTNGVIAGAIFAMIDRKLADEKVDHTFFINTLDFYLEIDKWTIKKENRDYSRDVLSKKLNLISSDGTVFEVDYGVAFMSYRFEEITEAISVDTRSVHKLSCRMLTMLVDYCNKHKFNRLHLRGFNIKDWDAEFLDVDPKTLLDLLTSACYMKIDSLVKLAWSKVDGLIKGKTPEEINEIFGVTDDSNSKLLEGNNE